MRRTLHDSLMLLPLFLFLAFCGPCAAASQETVSETVLPNGLKVLLLENHKAPVITFQVWYRVGSRNEEYSKTGLSHLLEHMMFRGTEQVRPGEFSRIIQENGGQHNAFTSTDNTTYYQNLSADRVNVSLELESDRMQHLMLREQDFLTERSVVMEERRLRTDDNPKAIVWEQLDAVAFQVQPYHWPVIGWMQDIARLTVDDLRNYYKRFYNPVNAVLVVAGDFKKDELLPKIERLFGTIPKGVPPESRVPLEEPQNGERRIVIKREARLASVVIGYHVPNLREQDSQDSQDSYVLEVVEALLGSGESSRLQTGLVRKKKLALGVGVGNPLLSKDPGLFSISADVLPDKNVADVEKAIDEEIERLQREPVNERELQKVKNQLEAGFIFHQDSLFSQAMQLARYEMVLGWRAIDGYLPAIRKVSAEDIQRVAKRYLTQDNRTVAHLIPLPSTKVASRPPDSPTGEQGIR
jgi:zinc protease